MFLFCKKLVAWNVIFGIIGIEVGRFSISQKCLKGKPKSFLINKKIALDQLLNNCKTQFQYSLMLNYSPIWEIFFSCVCCRLFCWFFFCLPFPRFLLLLSFPLSLPARGRWMPRQRQHDDANSFPLCSVSAESSFSELSSACGLQAFWFREPRKGFLCVTIWFRKVFSSIPIICEFVRGGKETRKIVYTKNPQNDLYIP